MHLSPTSKLGYLSFKGYRCRHPMWLKSSSEDAYIARIVVLIKQSTQSYNMLKSQYNY